MWRACKLGYRHEPSLMFWSFALAILAALPDALLALWLALLVAGVQAQDTTRIQVAALALALSAAGTWLLRVLSTRLSRRFRDRVTIALESHVARLQASIATIAHQERPEYLDRLSVLRDQIFVLDHMYLSLFSTCGWMLRLGVTVEPARVDPCRAGASGAVRAADCADLELASGGGAAGSGARRGRESTRASPVHPRHHGAARQGGARHWHWRQVDRRTTCRLGAVVRADCSRAVGLRGVAHAGLGGLRRGVRWRNRLRCGRCWPRPPRA